ncbi:hypothetical protein Dimus_007232 [Dionaea muscipula]
MKNTLHIVVAAASSTTTSTATLNPHHSLFKLNHHPTSFSIFNPISISLSLFLSKHSSPSSSRCSCPTTTIPESPPLPLSISSFPSNPEVEKHRNSLSYCAHVASKLVEDGRFEDFEKVLESVLSDGVIEPFDFGELLDLKLVSGGIVKGLREGRIQGVVGFLGSFRGLGVDIVGLFHGPAMELLGRECRRIVRDGNLEEVVEIMETLAGFGFPIRQLVKLNDLITRCLDKRSPDIAVRYAGLLPHPSKVVCTIIQGFGKRKDLLSALTAFETSEKMGHINMYVYRAIIDVCGLCSDCLKSRSIYEDLLAREITPNIYVLNSLMNVNAHDVNYTMGVYKKMQNLGVIPDMASYNILLKSCCLAGRVDLAQDIYKDVQLLESTGALKLDLFTYSTIVKIFADAKLWQMALKIKEDMLSAGVTPNMVTWSSLINACANAGVFYQATQLFEEMLLAGCEPNTQCFNTLLNAYVEASLYDQAFRLFHAWKSNGSKASSGDVLLGVAHIGEDHVTSMPYNSSASLHLTFTKSIPFRPTTSTYNILMKACGRDYYRARALMDDMKIFGLSPNHISWSTLINICGEAGDVEGALQFLNSMRDNGIIPDVVAYTTAIKVCVGSKNLKTAFRLFAEMKKNQIQPNLVTYNTLLRARTRYGTLHQVQQCLAIYLDKRKAGYRSNDYYLKQLIEEWCEGVLQSSNPKANQHKRGTRVYSHGQESPLLERVAMHLQKDSTESMAIDIQGLTRVESRIVVLAVLRMIKEKHALGHTIKDDLIIILGAREVCPELRDTVTDLLKDELGLGVIPVKPRVAFGSTGADSETHDVIETKMLPAKWDNTPRRRPAVLERLLVTKNSLYQWLQKKPGAAAAAAAAATTCG